MLLPTNDKWLDFLNLTMWQDVPQEYQFYSKGMNALIPIPVRASKSGLPFLSCMCIRVPNFWQNPNILRVSLKFLIIIYINIHYNLQLSWSCKLEPTTLQTLEWNSFFSAMTAAWKYIHMQPPSLLLNFFQ
jgi:hypothetical protein